jgi:hypothetical protein
MRTTKAPPTVPLVEDYEDNRVMMKQLLEMSATEYRSNQWRSGDQDGPDRDSGFDTYGFESAARGRAFGDPPN